MQKIEGNSSLSGLWYFIEDCKKYRVYEEGDGTVYQRKHPDKHGVILLAFHVQEDVAYSMDIRMGTVTVTIGSNDVDHVLLDGEDAVIYLKNSGVTINLN